MVVVMLRVHESKPMNSEEVTRITLSYLVLFRQFVPIAKDRGIVLPITKAREELSKCQRLQSEEHGSHQNGCLNCCGTNDSSDLRLIGKDCRFTVWLLIQHDSLIVESKE